MHPGACSHWNLALFLSVGRIALPTCTYCHKPFLPGQHRTRVNAREYHNVCFEQHQEHERRRTVPPVSVDLVAMKARLVAGVLPRAEDVAVRFVRHASGVCVGCDGTFASNHVGVQFDAGRGRRLLHPDCYVLWTAACAG